VKNSSEREDYDPSLQPPQLSFYPFIFKSRRNLDYDKADSIRSALQRKGIKIDDSMSRWWLQEGVPASLSAAKGDGHWARAAMKQDWVCVEGAESVDSDFIEALLQRREEKRRAKDFATADALYMELKDLGIVVNDSNKTWRVWSEVDGVRPMKLD
jgi:cysteinyl-tRNA synthetase